MSNKIETTKSELTKKKYDLLERTSLFGENIIIFVKSIPNDLIVNPLKVQLLRSGTSIGANYMEADGAESKADFRHKIALAKKEAKETTYWLRMITKANQESTDRCRELYQEAHELTLIFASILIKN